MPIRDTAQIQRIAYMCGATIPARLARRLERADTPEAAEEVGVAWVTRRLSFGLTRVQSGQEQAYGLVFMAGVALIAAVVFWVSV